MENIEHTFPLCLRGRIRQNLQTNGKYCVIRVATKGGVIPDSLRAILKRWVSSWL